MRSGDPPQARNLATGNLSERDAAELSGLKERIEALAGFRCGGYKERCLRRRIAVRMRARQVHTYAEYAALLDGDSDEQRTLIDTVTINVSKFFRNREVWTLVADHVIPHLAALDDPEIRIWSAGCAAGEEIHTVAILLLEHAAREGLDLRRFHLLGTDVDHAALADAERAEYSDFAFTETPLALRRRWFEGDDLRRLRPEVRSPPRRVPRARPDPRRLSRRPALRPVPQRRHLLRARRTGPCLRWPARVPRARRTPADGQGGGAVR